MRVLHKGEDPTLGDFLKIEAYCPFQNSQNKFTSPQRVAVHGAVICCKSWHMHIYCGWELAAIQ